MPAGSNTVEFRIVQTLAPNGQVSGERWQVRTKDTIISLLGVVSLGSWTEWQEINTTVVTEVVDGT